MSWLWIGLGGAAAFLTILAVLPCPGCEARRARIKQAIADFHAKRS